MTGIIKSFSDRHGYGFIVGELNEIFFAHKLDFQYLKPRPGDKVEFESEITAKGSRARNIRREHGKRREKGDSGKK